MKLLNFIKRAIFKKLIGPLKYKKKNDYNAKKYWDNRFKKYGLNYKGAGHDGMSEEENKQHYEENKQSFLNLLNKENLDLKKLNILEIGPGNGFYTQLMKDLGVKNYTAVDITDVLFPKLKQKFPDYTFIKKDATKEFIKEKYDLIIMIEVILHIVNPNKLTFAMNNVKNSLNENGKFILAPITKNFRREFFYIKWWSLEEIKKRFENYHFSELQPYRNDFITVIRKN